MMTFEEGRMSTWRLPRRSALTMLFYKDMSPPTTRIQGALTRQSF